MKYFLILLILISPVFALQYDIIQESESGFHLRISNDSEFQWDMNENYPDVPSYFSLGNANLIPISNSLSIPYWSFPLALPLPQKPQIQISNITTEELRLDRRLDDNDTQIINAKPIADVVDIGFFRFNPAGDLVVFPVRIISNQRIRIVRSLDITITYPKQSSVPSNLIPIKAKTNEIGNYTFLNRKFAYKWQFRPKRTLSKPTSFPLGQWFKITVIDDGIYDISLQDLKDAGFSEQRVNTNRIFLYSNSTGGREIDDTPGIDVLDNLVENSRFIDGGMDGYLDNDDNIRFYGRASSGMDANSSGILNYHQNSYSNYNYYWVLISDSPGSPKPMQTVASSASPNISVAKYERVQRHEVESVNYLRSGKDWYGEKFHGSGSNVSVIFQIPEPGDDDPPGYRYPVDLEVKTRGVTNEVSHYFKLYLNNSPNYLSNWSTSSFYIATKKLNISMDPGSINILKLNYTSSVSAGQAHLDYAQITYQCPLKPRGASMDFWGPASSGVVEYSLSDISLSSPVVYDITNWSDVKIQTTPDVPTNNEITLRAYNNITDRSHFLITNTEHHKSPEKIEKIDDPQWNVIRRPDISAQYVIITVEEFQDAANDLAKLYSQDIREEDRLSTIVVYQSQILREFNADIVDPHAIRQFLTYTFRNWTPPLPEYVLLLGDGTFDYRHIESEKGDIVMTYQVEPSSQSGNGFVSYSADTRFVYTCGSDNKMDLAIGRINARTADEAQAVIDKIRNYILEPIYGEWRSTVTLVADDPERPHSNEKYHISDSESYIFKHLPGSIDVKKVYLLEYPEVQDASTYGVKKPDATTALLKQIEKGTTIINYLGHGSPTVWTQEHILDMNRDMGNIKSGMKLPFWIAATCSWGQFDDITGICMPEALVVEPNNGAIAALAPTRATYPGSNRAFINSWIMKWFNPVGANRISLGKLLQAVSCSGSGINENNEKYMLFGDPALYLALPYEKVKFNRLDTDTLKTLSNIQVHGMIDENDGASFNGEGIIKLFDSERLVTRHYTDSNGKPQSLSYLILGDVLFNGLTNISNGKFSSKFFIPKDLNYANRNGKITIYGWNPDTGDEIGGFYDSLYFAGSESVFDTTGPTIDIGFTNIDFRNGDIVTPESQFEIAISDPHGINIAGKMGHDIILTINDGETASYRVTEYFSYNANSDTSGTIILSMPELSPGEHKSSVTAWDNGNNSTTTTCIFNLLSSSDFKLKNVVNYPNPFGKITDITFYVTHSSKIECLIYTVRGLKIKTIDTDQLYMPGFNSIHWNGADDFGDIVAKGIYIYKIKATSIESDEKDHFIGKMVKAG
jgi:hypothetical protein